MSCERYRPKLLEFVEGELRGAVAASVQAHVEACPACRAEVERWRHVRASVAAAPIPPPAQPDWDAFERHVLARVRDSRAPRIGRRLAPAALLAAVAAVVLLVAGGTPTVPPSVPAAPVVPGGAPALQLADVERITDELDLAWQPGFAWDVDAALADVDAAAMDAVPTMLAQALEEDLWIEPPADAAVADDAEWLDDLEAMDEATFEMFLSRLHEAAAS